MDTVLVVGGAGYIGSHTCKALKARGFTPVVYDNLSRGHRDNVKWGPLVVGDLLDRARLDDAFRTYQPKAVIHFAALAYVGESVTDPGPYYVNNVSGTISMLEAARRSDCNLVVFSSTCATYGVPETLPITEQTTTNPINPYGRTKLMIESVLSDYAASYGIRYAALRYFNACGADPAGELGEWHDPETHLIPRALMAAAGDIEQLEIFGDDYPTPDGTCIRDYIHVADLAAGHVQAVDYLSRGGESLTVNLGTDVGLSIKDILTGIEKVTGRAVPAVMKPRRPGDPPALVASADLAREKLGFVATHSSIDSIVETAWRQFGASVS